MPQIARSENYTIYFGVNYAEGIAHPLGPHSTDEDAASAAAVIHPDKTMDVIKTFEQWCELADGDAPFIGGELGPQYRVSIDAERTDVIIAVTLTPIR